MTHPYTGRPETLARDVRIKILEASLACGESTHIGGSLSLAEILSVLYAGQFRIHPELALDPSRDRVILSKGHAALALYSVLNLTGFIPEEVFSEVMHDYSELIAHPIRNLELGIESSNGSLGHGLAYASGTAWALKRRGFRSRVFVILGDGECNEGSVWESAANISNLELNNVTSIIDANGLQNDGATTSKDGVYSLAKQWSAFGWRVEVLDGHNVNDLLQVLSKPIEGPPLAVIARTIKGKGVSFMEANNEWHHSRLTRANFERAMSSLGEGRHAIQ